MNPGKSNVDDGDSHQEMDEFTKQANWLRSFKGCEHYTDEEANKIIESLDTVAAILLEAIPEKIHNIDNQLVVSLNSQKQNRAA